MKDGRCNVHYKGIRCSRSWRHDSKKHLFHPTGEVKELPMGEIRKWARSTGECTSPGKVPHKEHYQAALSSVKQSLISKKDIRVYFCTCRNYHLAEAENSTRKTLKGVANDG